MFQWMPVWRLPPLWGRLGGGKSRAGETQGDRGREWATLRERECSKARKREWSSVKERAPSLLSRLGSLVALGREQGSVVASCSSPSQPLTSSTPRLLSFMEKSSGELSPLPQATGPGRSRKSRRSRSHAEREISRFQAEFVVPLLAATACPSTTIRRTDSLPPDSGICSVADSQLSSYPSSLSPSSPASSLTSCSTSLRRMVTIVAISRPSSPPSLQQRCKPMVPICC